MNCLSYYRSQIVLSLVNFHYIIRRYIKSFFYRLYWKPKGLVLDYMALTASICVVLTGDAANLCSAPPRAEELEQKAISYRLENIRRGYVKMKVVDDPDSQPMERLYEITFDENRVRQLRRIRQLGKTEWGEPRTIIVTPEKYLADHEELSLGLPVQIAPANDYKSPREHLGILNLQALGMDIHGIDMLHRAHVESLLNRTDRSNITAQTDHRGDLATWRIDFQMKQQATDNRINASLWIAPSQGFSVVGIRLLIERDGKLRTFAIDSELKEYLLGNVWFPSRVIKTVEFDGRVLNRQTITIEDARFGEHIEDAVFTLNGLELKPGKEVIDSTSGQPWLKVWDGKELAAPSDIPTAPTDPDRHRRLLWLLAVGLGLTAAFYFRRVIKQRRSIPSSGP